MKWIPEVPEKLYVLCAVTSKQVLVHAFWLAVSKGCVYNQEDAQDLCFTWINEARVKAGLRRISRERVLKWVKEREDHRAEIASRRTG
jgi:hypothetical protein